VFVLTLPSQLLDEHPGLKKDLSKKELAAFQRRRDLKEAPDHDDLKASPTFRAHVAASAKKAGGKKGYFFFLIFEFFLTTAMVCSLAAAFNASLSPATPATPRSHKGPTCVDEIFSYIGSLLLMAISTLPRIEQYWEGPRYLAKLAPLTDNWSLKRWTFINKNFKIYNFGGDDSGDSINLAIELLKKEVHLVGTTRGNRTGRGRGESEEDKKERAAALKEEGAAVWRAIEVDGQVITIVNWHDRKVVEALSTCHVPGGMDTCERKRKDEAGEWFLKVLARPELIAAYNEFMGGVDLFDQYVNQYIFDHKTVKWTHRVWYWQVQVFVFTAYRLLKVAAAALPAEHKKLLPEDMQEFQLLLGEYLIYKYRERAPKRHEKKGKKAGVEGDYGCFGPTPLKVYDEGAKGREGAIQRLCAREGCGKKTTFGCSGCKVSLCAAPCFGMYHACKE
jgi:hypothetical protein